jgi:hypothetical protein
MSQTTVTNNKEKNHCFNIMKVYSYCGYPGTFHLFALFFFQGLALAKQALYYLSHAPVLSFFR